MTKKHGGDFSRQKLFQTFSMIFMPLVCGTLIDVVSNHKGWFQNVRKIRDYLTFYLYYFY
jgi:hypothetical protein